MVQLVQEMKEYFRLTVEIRHYQSEIDPSRGEIVIRNNRSSGKTVRNPLLTIEVGRDISFIKVYSKPGHLIHSVKDSSAISITTPFHLGQTFLVSFKTDSPYELKDIMLNGDDFVAVLSHQRNVKELKDRIIKWLIVIVVLVIVFALSIMIVESYKGYKKEAKKSDLYSILLDNEGKLDTNTFISIIKQLNNRDK